MKLTSEQAVAVAIAVDEAIENWGPGVAMTHAQRSGLTTTLLFVLQDEEKLNDAKRRFDEAQ